MLISSIGTFAGSRMSGGREAPANEFVSGVDRMKGQASATCLDSAVTLGPYDPTR